ncbi:hypothetical protein MLD38_004084 [Melastoma candidum]|uniref:Uncharacterized protein n=1 Tax=Melastoma candidum TaxID=119954 RepID=A0ACB9S4W8_9MYRT|nr:hypothetical protein MLD38_004084 [Melastoma candidum]
MAQVLHFRSSSAAAAVASPPSSPTLPCAPRPSVSEIFNPTPDPPSPSSPAPPRLSVDGYHGDGSPEVAAKDCDGDRDQISLLALLVTIFRKSFVGCRRDRRPICTMEIGWPTDVQHVAHVTFDRFNGFLGLPVEFEPEVPRRAPSASARVFGVSAESMQLSYDSRGNSVPTILLLMQRRLYAQGGLEAEGIFRINGENGQEEYVRDQLSRGVLPEGIDVHSLAGLIKAWFRELPTGVLDSLSPERVMQSQTEEECAELARTLPVTEAALLDWAINLMADVAQMETYNKMNARNIAMVFAPNMTQMVDPLTALMYAVQVMNFLKTLIERILRQREDSSVQQVSCHDLEPFNGNGPGNSTPSLIEDEKQDLEEVEPDYTATEPLEESSYESDDSISVIFKDPGQYPIGDKIEPLVSEGDDESCVGEAEANMCTLGQSSETTRRLKLRQPAIDIAIPVDKSRVIESLSRIDSRTEWIEAWR